MANSRLLGTLHAIPEELLEYLKKLQQQLSQDPAAKGLKRLNGLIGRGYCTYEQLKRVKNYFDHVDPNTVSEAEYLSNGGDPMKNWVNDRLEKIRGNIYRGQKNKADTAMVQTDDVTAPDANVDLQRSVIDAPNMMSSNDLMEQVSKIRDLFQKL